MDLKKDRLPLGKASVEVEYGVVDGQASVLWVLINGIWIDADEHIAEFFVQGWNEHLTRQEREAANEDSAERVRATGAVGAAAVAMLRKAA